MRRTGKCKAGRRPQMAKYFLLLLLVLQIAPKHRAMTTLEVEEASHSKYQGVAHIS